MRGGALTTFSVAFLVSHAPCAQVPPPSGGAPPGGALRLVSSTRPSIQVIDVDGGGTVTDIADPLSVLTSIEAGFIDPVTGDVLYALGASSSLGQIGTSTILLGSVIQQSTILVDLGTLFLPTGLELGPNGHTYLLDGPTIWALDSSYQAVGWDNPSRHFAAFLSAGNVGASLDWGREKLWAAVFLIDAWGAYSGGVLEYDTSRDMTPGVGIELFDLQSAGVAGALMDVTYGADSLYLSVDNNPTSSVWRYDLATSALTPVAGIQGVRIHSLAFNRLDSTLHLMEGTFGFPNPPDRYHVLDPATGSLTTILSPGVGSETDIILNDFLDLTSVVPERAESTVQTTFGFAAHGRKGDPAGVAITKVNGSTIAPLVLGTGLCDWGGFYPAPSITVAAGSFAPGDTVTISSARLDVATGGIVWGADATVHFR